MKINEQKMYCFVFRVNYYIVIFFYGFLLVQFNVDKIKKVILFEYIFLKNDILDLVNIFNSIIIFIGLLNILNFKYFRGFQFFEQRISKIIES